MKPKRSIMQSGAIAVNVGYDGSCPRSLDDAEIRDKTIVFFPMRWKRNTAEAACGGGRFDAEIRNKSSKPHRITLILDWDDPEGKIIAYHDFLFVRHARSREWETICGTTRQGRGVFDVQVRPGTTIVCQNPRYNYAQYTGFVRSALRDRRVSGRLAGRSREGRDIWLLGTTSEGSPNDRTRVMIVAVNHAYESAGSYCVEGMLEFLLGIDPWARFFMEKCSFHIMPMTNPDGVHNGLNRLTSLDGADLNRVFTKPDESYAVLKRTIDDVRPRLFINIHNWMVKYSDGLLCRNAAFARAVQTHMPDQIAYGKTWYVETLEEIMKKTGTATPSRAGNSWKNYCEEEFGSIGLTFEFPWFGRNAAAMRATGASALKASLMALFARPLKDG